MDKVIKFPNKKGKYEKDKLIEVFKGLLDVVAGDIHLVVSGNKNNALIKDGEKDTGIILTTNIDEFDELIKNKKVYVDMKKEVLR